MLTQSDPVFVEQVCRELRNDMYEDCPCFGKGRMSYIAIFAPLNALLPPHNAALYRLLLVL